MATVTIGELHESEYYEKIITKVNSKGVKTRRKKCQKGFKLVGGMCRKIDGGERLTRSKAAKRAAKKRVTKRQAINRKTKKARRIRRAYGL